MDQKRIIKKYRLKEGVKTALTITCIYLLFICYLLAAAARTEAIENNQEAYKTRSIQLFTK